MAKKASDRYFDQYGSLQHYKHYLLRYYLGGWFPKLAHLRARILYCETHAGQGIHKTGEKGSPVIALETLLDHPQRDAILEKSEAYFLFFEINPQFAAKLRGLVEGYNLPQKVHVIPRCGDSRRILAETLDELANASTILVPTLTFVDPFGYDIPLSLVHRCLGQPHGEVLVTFMAKNVAMAMRDPTKEENLAVLYGSDLWVSAASVDEFEERKSRAVDLYRDAVAARWCTVLRLRGQTDYALMHFTNHDDGRDLMKKAVWSTDKTGCYQVYGTDDPRQGLLVEPAPDLQPLEEWLRTQFAGQLVEHAHLREWLRSTAYLDKHLNRVLSRGRTNGWIETRHKGRFGPKMRSSMLILDAKD